MSVTRKPPVQGRGEGALAARRRQAPLRKGRDPFRAFPPPRVAGLPRRSAVKPGAGSGRRPEETRWGGSRGAGGLLRAARLAPPATENLKGKKTNPKNQTKTPKHNIHPNSAINDVNKEPVQSFPGPPFPSAGRRPGHCPAPCPARPGPARLVPSRWGRGCRGGPGRAGRSPASLPVPVRGPNKAILKVTPSGRARGGKRRAGCSCPES